MESRPRPLADSAGRLPSILDVRVHDALGVKDFATWIVQLLVALGAAYLGARLGGKTARETAIAAVSDEWQRERRHARERLVKRVRSNLRRVELLSDRCVGHKPELPLDPDVGEELEVIWNLYYRVAEPIFTLGSDDLSERLDSFFVKTHTLAETIKVLETRAREVAMAVPETVKWRDTHKARQKLPEERRAALAKIAELGAEATGLLVEMERAVPQRAP